MAKQISQETFDDVVRENMQEFDMTAEEALEDAVKQFESQVKENVRPATRENRSSGFPNRSDINRSVQSQKKARSLRFWM